MMCCEPFRVRAKMVLENGTRSSWRNSPDDHGSRNERRSISMTASRSSTLMGAKIREALAIVSVATTCTKRKECWSPTLPPSSATHRPLPANQRRGPGETGSESRQAQEISPLEAPGSQRFSESDWDRPRRRIAVTVDVVEDLVVGEAQLHGYDLADA